MLPTKTFEWKPYEDNHDRKFTAFQCPEIIDEPWLAEHLAPLLTYPQSIARIFSVFPSSELENQFYDSAMWAIMMFERKEHTILTEILTPNCWISVTDYDDEETPNKKWFSVSSDEAIKNRAILLE